MHVHLMLPRKTIQVSVLKKTCPTNAALKTDVCCEVEVGCSVFTKAFFVKTH
jgi:hypothetical protein